MLYSAIPSDMNFGFRIYLISLSCHYIRYCIVMGWRHNSTHVSLCVLITFCIMIWPLNMRERSYCFEFQETRDIYSLVFHFRIIYKSPV